MTISYWRVKFIGVSYYTDEEITHNIYMERKPCRKRIVEWCDKNGEKLMSILEEEPQIRRVIIHEEGEVTIV